MPKNKYTKWILHAEAQLLQLVPLKKRGRGPELDIHLECPDHTFKGDSLYEKFRILCFCKAKLNISLSPPIHWNEKAAWCKHLLFTDNAK